MLGDGVDEADMTEMINDIPCSTGLKMGFRGHANTVMIGDHKFWGL